MDNSPPSPIQKAGKENAHTKTESGEAKKSGGVKTKDVVFGIIEAAVGGGFFTAFGELLESLGFHSLKIWCQLAALLAVVFAFAHLFAKSTPPKQKIIWSTYSLICIVAFIAVGIFQYRSKPESKPYPHISFVLQSDINSQNSIELTNSLLIVTNYVKPNPLPLGFVLVPHHLEKSNATIQFIVKNNGPGDCENLQIVLSISRRFSVVPDPKWQLVAPMGMNINSEKREVSSWGYRVPPIHPGDGCGLPLIRIDNPPILDLRRSTNPIVGFFSILARAKDSPSHTTGGILAFVPYITNAFHKPIVLPWTFKTNESSDIIVGLEKNN